jgi:hypothetical protein
VREATGKSKTQKSRAFGRIGVLLSVPMGVNEGTHTLSKLPQSDEVGGLVSRDTYQLHEREIKDFMNKSAVV